MCAAAYQLQLFGEDPEVYYDQFFSDDRHRIVLRPTKPANILRLEYGKQVMLSLHWGLVPFWAKDKKIAYQTFNARAETVAEKPAFRDSFKKRRGVLVWESYVEWREESGKKIPYAFGITEPGPMFFAGLWASWGKDEGTLESCTLITCEPNSLAAGYHDRMPVVLRQVDINAWLDPEANDEDIRRFLVPFDDSLMTVRPANSDDFKGRSKATAL